MSTDDVQAPIVHGTISVSELFVANVNGAAYSGGGGGGGSTAVVHTYPVTVADGKFVVAYLSRETGSISTVYNDEHHTTTTGDDNNFGFWLYGPGRYRFDQSDASNAGHPLKFSTVGDGTHALGLEFYGTIQVPTGHDAVDAGVSYVGTPGSAGAYTQIDVRATPMGVGVNGGYHTPDLYVYCPNHSGMGFGPIAVDFVGFRLQGLINELTYGISAGSVWSAIKQDILSSIGQFIDTTPPTFSGGRFDSGASDTLTATVGSTFDPFTYTTPNVTCTDTPTAGPNKGTTETITLGADNFLFVDTLPGTTVLPIGNVLDNLAISTPTYGTVSGVAQKGADIDGVQADALFGSTVAANADGTILAVGAPYGDYTSGASIRTDAGYVRVYQLVAGAWSQLGSDIQGVDNGDLFGHSLALSADGTILAVGQTMTDWLYGASVISDAGSVKVYQYADNSWSQLGGIINGENSNDQGGYSVSLSSDGTILAMGAPQHTGYAGASAITNAGQVRIFHFVDGTWSQIGDLTGEMNEDKFGSSVSLSSDGTLLAVGAPYKDKAEGASIVSDAGQVRVYQYASSTWSQLGNSIDGEASTDYSGSSISLSSDGTILAIGAPGNNGVGTANMYTDGGHVRVYQWDGSSWTQLGSDIDGASSGAFMGQSVSLSSDGTILAAGANGQSSSAGFVGLYEYSDNSWTQMATLDGAAANDKFGTAVALSDYGNHLVVGGPNTAGSSTPGHARAFELTGRLDPTSYQWAPGSTWKTAGTYYLRYKATDASGNDTPNDADHYLTITVA